MDVKRNDELEWKPAGYAGGERAVLHMSAHEGRTSLVRIAAGTRAPAHRHEACEHVLVLTGKISISGHVLGPGDYLFTDSGEVHDLVALEDATFFVSSERPVHVVEATKAA
jgi:quercetin dioxygenase-like cupin family protein